jgi:hypothetical protein
MNRFAVARLAPLLCLCLSASCAKVAPDPQHADADSKSVARPQDGNVTSDEIKNYLDGKSLLIPGEGALPGDIKDSRTIVIKKENIRALSIGDGASVNRGPWNHDITLLYDNGKESYAVECSVEHKLVEDKQAFFGFTVKRVVKQ